jgi:uncharacterized SAM-binding protein YcdF (DUF218 family)
MPTKRKKLLHVGLIGLLFVILLLIFSKQILITGGRWLVVSDTPTRSDAIVVLNTGVEIYPRLIQAASLHSDGFADKVIINGNRKTEVLRDLEEKGFQRCCVWYEDSIRILGLLGVPSDKIIPISAEDAYDTVSEAEIVGKQIVEKGFARIILATSKYHTRRARFIWKGMYEEKIEVYTVAAMSDIYNPQGWWREGKQIRWVLAEYGAWIYYYWKLLKDNVRLHSTGVESGIKNQK